MIRKHAILIQVRPSKLFLASLLSPVALSIPFFAYSAKAFCVGRCYAPRVIYRPYQRPTYVVNKEPIGAYPPKIVCSNRETLVPVYYRPNTSSSVLRYLQVGSPVLPISTISSDYNSWTRINHENIQGFVFSYNLCSP